MAFRFVVTAFAAAGAVYAQSDSCSVEGTATVASPADATNLVGSCTTFEGNIAIATEAAGDINFPSVRRITGDLTVEGATNVSSVSADSLQSIGGKFGIDNLQNLNTVNFQALSEVGELSFTGLPNLNSLNFPQTIRSAQSLNIQNTFLSTLSGINLEEVDTIYIANNRLLQDISFQVSNLTGTINIESNGDKLTCSFPNLITARNITFRDVPSVSIPSLTNTTGSLGFYENTFDTIHAPNLTAVGGTLAINTNEQLTNVSFPVLRQVIGGVQIQNNTALEEIEFPALEEVRGATDMYGNFTSVSLPALKDNRGAFNIQSSGDIGASCDVFNGQRGSSNVIKGKFQCASSQTNPGGQNSKPSGNGTTGDAGSLSINKMFIGAGAAAVAVLAF